MTREAIRPIAALVAAVFAAGALAACGGSDSSTTGSSPSSESASQTTTEGSGSKDRSSESAGNGLRPKQGDGSGDSASSVQAAPLKVSGGGSAQYRSKGGDNSIQSFGEESGETELEEAAAALHGFLVARAGEDWPGACSYMAKAIAKQFEVLASRSKQLAGKGCAGILQALSPPLPAAVRQESTVVDAGSLRLEGERAFLIYRGAEGTGYAMLMTQEDGAWKVASLAPTPLS